MRTNHCVGESPQELREIWCQLPVRGVRRWREPQGPTEEAGYSDPAFHQEEYAIAAERISTALAQALTLLSSDDQELLRLRYDAALPVSRISEHLGIDASVLYRRLELLTRSLKSALEAEGITSREISQILGHPTAVLAAVLTRQERSPRRLNGSPECT